MSLHLRFINLETDSFNDFIYFIFFSFFYIIYQLQIRANWLKEEADLNTLNIK